MTLANATEFARQVVQLVDSQPLLSCPAEREINVRMGALAMARARGLVVSMVALVEAKRYDALGILLRNVYEVWLAGLYALHAGEEELAALKAHRDYWTADVARKMDLTIELTSGGESLSVWRMAKRLDELLAGVGSEVAARATSWYNNIYASESFDGIHAATAIARHIDVSGDEISIVFETDESDAGLARLKAGTILLAQVASEVWEAGGVEAIG